MTHICMADLGRFGAIVVTPTLACTVETANIL